MAVFDRILSPMRVALREGLVWFVVLTGFYFALISSYDWPEIAVGLGSGAIGAVAAVLTRSAERLRYRPELAWLRWLGPLPAAVLGDTVRLAVLLAGHVVARRPVRSTTREIRFPTDGTSRGSAHRAIGALAISFAPGSYVVDVNADTGVVLVNDLGAAESSTLEDMVTR